MPLRADLPALIAAATEKAAQAGAEHVLGVSRMYVPIEEGTLARSGATATQGNRAVVYYDTVYAVIQHEATEFRHDRGRTAKYLERPMNEERSQVLRIMRDTVARALGD